MTHHDQTTGRTVVGMFDRREAAAAAIRDLRAAGFTEAQIGLSEADAGGSLLLTVNAGQRTAEALEVLERHGAGAPATTDETTAEPAPGNIPGTAGMAAAVLGETAAEPGAAEPVNTPHSAWEGLDRRKRDDPLYRGPQRRLVRA